MNRPLRVLLVEDSKNDSILILHELRDGGFDPVSQRVETADAMKAALLSTQWDIIISDYTMPRFDGLASLTLLKESGIDLPFIIVSGTIGEDVAVTAMKAGAHDYIMKNNLKRLVPAVQRELREAEVRRERRQAETALRESEERFRSIVETTQEWIWEIDLQGRMIYNNPAIEKILGYAVEEIKGKSSLMYMHEEDRQEVERVLPNLIAEKFGWNNLVLRWRHKDGTYRWLESNAVPLIDAHDTMVGYRGADRDVTERRRAEEQLRQSEEQFRLITENVADLIAVLDLEGKRLYNSPSYKDVLDDPEKLRGTDSFQEIHSEDREKIKHIFHETVKTGIGQRAEYRFVKKDGTIRYIESQGSVIRDKEGNVSKVVVVSRDVTEKKKLEQQFLRSQRMESIGTLAGGIAHDLNNVLAPIIMAMEVLRKRIPDKDMQRILNTLEASARRGAGMVKQVLAFGRGMSGERTVVQSRHLIDEMAKIASDTFPKSIQIRTDISKDLWTVSADPTQLHQVLINLCVNSRDAMPNGGSLTLKAGNVELDENYARMHIEAKAGPYVIIEISDTGAGMPREIVEKIFEPFFTTKEIGKGTGLGLSTTLAIVKSHGGFINVYSEVSKGTVFKVYLPALLRPETLTAEGKEKELPAGRGEIILVVDDEASIREITKETLETYGYKVLTASDGTEAIALYAQNKNEIDVVLTDMMMPYMDGPTTIRALRKLDPQLKIIAASGLSTDGNPTTTADSGIQGFLSKPYTAEKLLLTLHDVLSSTPT
ncbi:MAG: PAS domain S-box protein [Ignavibacteria bacterium]|nr:PAS domain S-box protein [Ignavibacteria bacterium]